MSAPAGMEDQELMRLEDRFNVDGLHYLGGESRLPLLRQADVLLEGGGFTLPAHRCILSKGSKVLASLFESVPPPPTRTEQQELPAKRQRLDDAHGGAGGLDAPVAGTLAACTRLHTPFSDFSKTSVLLLLYLLYNSHRASRVARHAVGQPALVSELMQLCDALDAPRALRQLDAALEAALQRPDEPLDCSDGEDDDPLNHEPYWEEDSEQLLVSTLLAAERWQVQCPRWFGAAAARLGALLMNVCNVEQTRLPMQRLLDVADARRLSPDTLLMVMSCAVSCTRRALLQQPQGLSSLKQPAPAFHFMRNMHASMQDLLYCLYQPNGEIGAFTTVGQGSQTWQLSVSIPHNRPQLMLTVKRARGFECFDEVSGYRRLKIHAKVLSSTGRDVATEHALDFGHAELRGREAKRSGTPLVSVADLEDPGNGLLSERREIAIQLRVDVTCLDM
ncbi:putative uncharacterized protein LOC107376968 [Chlorella sorokiniana]|uniref:BTB domain-containing protein n=1 Tax=Chlorella sorokiniana TaxID=3076 RepID=A0A2P6TX73_CHLSO|nr:putative uncharacterized protein LOC107376968 [Chlorella sorokiniana]|eukprot:PRW58659.1 putative uncharacterized protein LOC107376968 [Chlorella sorokiniana]